MDTEAIQLLNLSPIPELSEIELSTMMDQLSGLSDINGDFNNQNVEEILKKAEDLIDKSSIKTTELSMEEISENEEKKLLNSNEEPVKLENKEECDVQELPMDETKHYNTPVNSDHIINEKGGEGDVQKQNSPVEQNQVKIFSPEGSCNHIKSTIDSLKEFSTLIEKQLSTKSPKVSPNSKTHEKNEHNMEFQLSNSHTPEKSGSKITKASDSPYRKNLVEPFDKSIKFLNCFERLYQNKPVRLCANRNVKVNDKIPKTSNKKKLTKGAKTLKNKSDNTIQMVSEDSVINPNDISLRLGYSMPYTTDMNLLRYHEENSFFNNFQSLPDLKSAEDKINQQPVENRNNAENSDSNLILSKVDQKLILKVLEEVEQIKTQVKKAGVFDDKSERTDDHQVIDSLKSEVESVREKVTSVSNAGIKRLQEQFSILKLKYYQQMDKLEAENLKLREALHSQQKFFASRRNINLNPSPRSVASIGTRNHTTSSSPSSCEKVDNSVPSVESAPEISCPRPSPTSPATREAFCQTEKETTHISVQCSEERKRETATETKKTENKENVTRGRFVRSKPFSDVGIHQLTRQKKLVDHESQLLATLRGLQTELTVKDKENKRMRAEMESLRKQIKKLASSKTENVRKSHTGTQTLGLGPGVQRPYIPELYEVPKEFEKENEDLKSRIKALEIEFELLKEKRVNDLQSLHQVHEEEIAKLVSKLETQSSLTKHLHYLLVNR